MCRSLPGNWVVASGHAVRSWVKCTGFWAGCPSANGGCGDAHLRFAQEQFFQSVDVVDAAVEAAVAGWVAVQGDEEGVVGVIILITYHNKVTPTAKNVISAQQS